MTNAETATELHFDPPGPGFWTLDAVHFPRPVTRYWAETHPDAMRRGTNDFARFYGMLIDGLQIAYVNGFGYNQVSAGSGGGTARSASSAPNKSSRKALAGAASRLGREPQTSLHRRRTGRSRPSIPTRSPTRSWSPI